MNDSLMDIYRQRVLEHSRAPHNKRQLADADREVTGFNPLCGDKLTVYLSLNEDTVCDVAFDGTGCAIAVASASMMTDALKNESVANARDLIAGFNAMFSDGTLPQQDKLEETRALENVRDYPSRIKCATLAWSAAEAALQNDNLQISTE